MNGIPNVPSPGDSWIKWMSAIGLSMVVAAIAVCTSIQRDETSAWLDMRDTLANLQPRIDAITPLAIQGRINQISPDDIAGLNECTAALLVKVNHFKDMHQAYDPTVEGTTVFGIVGGIIFVYFGCLWARRDGIQEGILILQRELLASQVIEARERIAANPAYQRHFPGTEFQNRQLPSHAVNSIAGYNLPKLVSPAAT